MLRSSRLPLLVALIALLCGGSAHAARPLRVACAHGRALRYVERASACRRSERVVDFRRRAVRVCIAAHGLRLGRCGSSVVLPAARARTFCVDRRTRQLRRPPCRRRRAFKVVLAGRPLATPVVPAPVLDSPVAPVAPDPVAPVAPAPVAVARADEAMIDEDHPVAIAVLDNDSGDGLRLSAVDAGGAVGSVVAQDDGTILYDPRGRFDELGPSEQATDGFSYRLAGGQVATVFVTVTGAADAPVIDGVEDAPLAYDTGAPAVPIAPSITVRDVDSDSLSGATVRIAAPGGEGELVGGASVAAGTPAEVEAALRAVAFRAGSLTASGSRRIELTVADGEGLEATAARDVSVHHVNLAPAAADDGFSGAAGNTALDVSGSVLANDRDADGGSLRATAAPATPSGASVSMRPDGTFTYVPPVGFTGRDSFAYTVHDDDPDEPRTAVGTVTVDVAGPVTWYVDSAAAPGGDGRSDAPFASLGPLSAGGAADALDGPGDVILLAGAAAPYPGGIVLEDDQRLVGRPAGAVNPLVDGGGAPTVTLAAGADVEHVDMRGSGAPAVAGTGVGSATIGAGTAITGDAGGVALDGGSGTLTIASAITTTGGHAVAVQHRSGGRVTFSGPIRDSGSGIELASNTGATLGFTGAITAPAFVATGGGTVSATGGGSTLATTTAPALDVRDTTIAAAGLKFQSVSSGIVLRATGAQGGVTVSGGTIADDVALTDTSRVSLKGLRVRGAIQGDGVHGLSLLSSVVDGGVALRQVDGDVDVEDSALGAGLSVDDASGTLTNVVLRGDTADRLALTTTGANLAAAQISANNVGAGGITLRGGGSYGVPSGARPGTGAYVVAVHDNTVSGPIAVDMTGGGNVAVNANTAGALSLSAAGTGTTELAADGNTVDSISLTTSTATARAELLSDTVRDNLAVATRDGSDLGLRIAGVHSSGIDLDAGSPLCADLTQNDTPALRLTQQPGATLGLADLTPDPATNAQAAAFLASANVPATATVAGSGPFGACALTF